MVEPLVRNVGLYLLVGCVCGGLACAPLTPVRRAALVPAATAPSRLGRPLDPGEFRLAGQLNPLRLASHDYVDFTPQVNDPGLLIPVAQVGGLAYVGLSRFFEIGAQLYYAPRQWARKNAVGVLGMAGHRPSMWMGGAGLRLNLRAPRSSFTMSLSTELNWAQVHEAVWVCGFDSDPTSVKQTTFSKYFLPVVGLGFEVRVAPMFINATFVMPLQTEPAIGFGPGLVLQTGVAFGGKS